MLSHHWKIAQLLSRICPTNKCLWSNWAGWHAHEPAITQMGVYVYVYVYVCVYDVIFITFFKLCVVSVRLLINNITSCMPSKNEFVYKEKFTTTEIYVYIRKKQTYLQYLSTMVTSIVLYKRILGSSKVLYEWRY